MLLKIRSETWDTGETWESCIIQPSLLRMYVEAYETLSHKSKFFYNMRCFIMFVTTVCVLFLLKLKWPKNKSFYNAYFPLLLQFFELPFFIFNLFYSTPFRHKRHAWPRPLHNHIACSSLQPGEGTETIWHAVSYIY